MSTGFWAYESVFYQIYPLGFCGAPFENDGVQTHKIKRRLMSGSEPIKILKRFARGYMRMESA